MIGGKKALSTQAWQRNENFVLDFLREIYQETLTRSAPSLLLGGALAREESRALHTLPVNVVALGKAAFSLAAAATELLRVERIFIAAPRGYGKTATVRKDAEIELGAHPYPDADSFRSGQRLIDFVRASSDPILFLISGGSSACVELPLHPWINQSELTQVHIQLLRAGLDIEQINTVRKHLSALKGGRLGELAPLGSRTYIYSDVSTGKERLVGSGPTLPDASRNEDAASILRGLDSPFCREIAGRLSDDRMPDTPATFPHADPVLIADNRNLVERAAGLIEASGRPHRIVADQIEGDVGDAAARLLEFVASAERGTVVVAGGEPTVRVTGEGVGGRCSELAVRFALAYELPGNCFGIFGSSDGVDGNTGAAGVVISTERARSVSRADFQTAFQQSDTFNLACRLGQALRVETTGNNLRDLYLLVRD